MGMTMVEKILARATGQTALIAGDVVEPRVDLAMSHENAALVSPTVPPISQINRSTPSQHFNTTSLIASVTCGIT